MAYTFKISDDTTLQLSTEDGVFFPTGTSLALIKAFEQKVAKPGKTLDLGCGCGIVGLVTQKKGLAKGPMYASDLGEAAVACTQKNFFNHGVEVVAKSGSLFEPWKGETFDYILDDVSGVAEEIAMVSPWFRNVSCESGVDGIDLVIQVIEQAPNYLTSEGILFFPIISLSNERKILDKAHEKFESVERLTHQEWPLPEEMKPHTELIMRLNREGHVTVIKKFGIMILYTDIYAAQKSRNK